MKSIILTEVTQKASKFFISPMKPMEFNLFEKGARLELIFEVQLF